MAIDGVGVGLNGAGAALAAQIQGLDRVGGAVDVLTANQDDNVACVAKKIDV